MAHESDSDRCDICSGRNLEVFPLNRQEKVLGAKICSFISLNVQLNQSCKPCVRRIYQLKAFLKDIYLNRTQIRSSHDQNKMDNEDPRKNPYENREEKHKYDCRCDGCRSKFGDLQLLADVIERHESHPSTSRDFSYHNQSAPSTSRGFTDSPASSSSKSGHSYQNRKEMKCLHCEKVFCHKGDLNKHVRTHTGEQPFVCAVCDRRFAHTSNLARHSRLHSGSRPFTCDSCMKSFSRKDKLELHMRTKSCRKT